MKKVYYKLKINFNKMRFYIEIKNEIGSFSGDELNGTQEQFDALKEKMSSFYNNEGYEMALADGSYIIVSPEVLKKSIFLIHILE